MTRVHVVIPARFGSSRLPGKPLLDIAGKPMVWHVWQRVLESGLKSAIIATDDERILNAATQFGGKALMTKASHNSGTERLAEVAEKMGWNDDDVVINVQGDEPLIDPALIVELAESLTSQPQAQMATLLSHIHSYEDFVSPNVVKAVINHASEAMYFSRAPIPWPRDSFAKQSKEVPDSVYRHIGMYGYRVSCLKRLVTLPESPLEALESLEQLRPLQSGIAIHCSVVANAPAHGVDTPEDWARVRALVEQGLTVA
ncbi:3-deoxy-manno-octulosonate cytidylyltransferase [Aliagarivorans marinus]|uniref:3-deoxy-manno-octulosonate cytidylyltransferase n=1 Tax=Aliagarivorans marinus TaxID=561965 RepID=UPI00047AF336|nr:3-deoxy-manno-octulosonate cytidylyltransferase [Aliagarivorans marinus]